MFQWPVAAVLAASLLTSAAWAETVQLHATLTGSSEVPPNDSKGTGTCNATLDTASRKLDYMVTYSGLTGPATGAHFHGPADPGTNAPIVVPFAPPASPIKGSATLTDTQERDLLAGKWYVNVHTEAHPGGEIRGQLVRAP